MGECCGSKQPKKAESSSCGGGAKKTVLLYACSGGANVAEIADKAARELMFEGQGSMFCLAGLGADIAGMVQTARDADVNLVIDGCPMDCAKKVFDRHGLKNYKQIRVTDLGIEKAKGVRCTEEQVRVTVAKAKEVLGAQQGHSESGVVMANSSVFTYPGNGRCVVRSREGTGQVVMDAPPHCGGSGENWTPGDWLGFAFAGCVIISMDNMAKKHGFDVAGTTVETEVQMGGGPPPKVTLLKAVVRLPRPLSAEQIAVLKQAAPMCPIHNSMAAETKVRVELVAG